MINSLKLVLIFLCFNWYCSYSRYSRNFYAIVFGLDASSIDLGSAENSRGSEISSQAKDLTANTLPQQILELLPSNPFLDFTGQRTTSTIAVVIFAIFVGFAYLRVARKQPESGSLLKRGIDAIYALVMSIVTFVLRLTPYGIIAIMASTIATSDFQAIWTLGKFMIASYAALITMYIIHLILLAVMGINPVRYVKKTLEVLIFAFTSRSSAGALPLNIQTQTQRLGVPDGIANFSASFGLSIGQNGCAGIYPAMLAIMVAPVANVDIDLPFVLYINWRCYNQFIWCSWCRRWCNFRIYPSIINFKSTSCTCRVLISIEPIIDMGRTALNVNDSILAGTGTAKLTGNMDKDKFNSNEYGDLSTN